MNLNHLTQGAGRGPLSRAGQVSGRRIPAILRLFEGAGVYVVKAPFVRAIEPTTEGEENEPRMQPGPPTHPRQPELQLHVLLRMLLLQLPAVRLQSGARTNRQVRMLLNHGNQSSHCDD